MMDTNNRQKHSPLSHRKPLGGGKVLGLSSVSGGRVPASINTSGGHAAELTPQAMLQNIQPVHSRKKPLIRSSAFSSKKGYTMSEIIIVIVVLGLLAAIAVPIYNNVRNAAADNVKIKNADMLNQLMTAVHNGGVDLSSWVDGATAISELRKGVSIPAVNPNAAPQQIVLEKELNAAAYAYTAGTTSRAPKFDPILNKPNVLP